YKQALEIEPDYVEAWDRLGLLYCMQANFGLMPASEGYELCRQATEKALALDPDYAPAISGLGWIAMQRDGNLAKAAEYYERALVLAPTNVSIIGDAATLLQLAGRIDEAIALVEFALARDPVNPIGYANLGTLYRYSGQLDKALAAYRTSLSLSPDRIGAHYQMGIVLLRKGDAEAALESFQREESEDWKVMGVALASHALGRTADFDQALDELKTGWGDRWPTEVAQVYAWVGDADAAFSWLEKSLDANGDGSWPDIRVDDLLAPLHDDPRWPGLANKLGVPAAQLSALEFSVPLPPD
ncbi:MAG: tetratricopeptide repeat protein, partial [Woeseia sp.]